MAKDEGLPVKVTWPEDALWPQAGYGNAFLINHTPWDFTVRVGQVVLPAVSKEVVQAGESLEVSAVPVAEITFPPAALRQLSDALVEQIEKYEETYGKNSLDKHAGEANDK